MYSLFPIRAEHQFAAQLDDLSHCYLDICSNQKPTQIKGIYGTDMFYLWRWKKTRIYTHVQNCKGRFLPVSHQFHFQCIYLDLRCRSDWSETCFLFIQSLDPSSTFATSSWGSKLWGWMSANIDRLATSWKLFCKFHQVSAEFVFRKVLPMSMLQFPDPTISGCWL